jgi:cytochrome c553
MKRLAVILGRLGLAAAALSSMAAHADLDAGRQKAQVCQSCHGEGGNSTQPAIPVLAGQPKQFIVSALFQFREGKRTNPIMTPLAADLSNKDLNDLADYFSAQESRPPEGKAAPDRVAQGREIAQRNNCTACHTATLTGQQHIPRLAGQHREYLATQLSAFKASTRGELDGVMTSAAQGLSAGDIEVLSDYLSTLTAP